MWGIIKNAPIITLFFFFTGIIACATTATAPVKLPPWVANPNLGGQTGGCGSAGIHIKGPHAQRELAVSRAIDELARQMQVKVSNITAVKISGNRDRVNADIKSYSVHTSKGMELRVKIKDVWQHPRTGRLYVWAVIDNGL